MVEYDVQQLLSLLYQADNIHHLHIAAALGFTTVAKVLRRSMPPAGRVAFAVAILAVYVSLSMYVQQLGRYYVFIYDHLFGDDQINTFHRDGFWKSWIILGASTAYILGLMAYLEWPWRKKDDREPSQ
jgi:hypothetical protein